MMVGWSKAWAIEQVSLQISCQLGSMCKTTTWFLGSADRDDELSRPWQEVGQSDALHIAPFLIEPWGPLSVGCWGFPCCIPSCLLWFLKDRFGMYQSPSMLQDWIPVWFVRKAVKCLQRNAINISCNWSALKIDIVWKSKGCSTLHIVAHGC